MRCRVRERERKKKKRERERERERERQRERDRDNIVRRGKGGREEDGERTLITVELQKSNKANINQDSQRLF